MVSPLLRISNEFVNAMNTRIGKNVTELHISCLFRHNDFDMLLGELYSRQTKPYRQSGNARLYVGSCFDSGSQHIEAPVEASNIYEIIPRNYANLAFCAGFQLNCMIYVNFDRRGRTCARLHLSLSSHKEAISALVATVCSPKLRPNVCFVFAIQHVCLLH